MTTTPAHTIADLNAMTERDEWLSFGYLGERRNILGHVERGIARADLADQVAEADMRAVDDANEHGLTLNQLFDWANSKYGRWYGDCMFGNGGLHAEKYLPSRFIAEVPEEDQR